MEQSTNAMTTRTSMNAISAKMSIGPSSRSICQKVQVPFDDSQWNTGKTWNKHHWQSVSQETKKKEVQVVELKEPEKEEDDNDEDKDGVAKGDDSTKEKGNLDDEEE